ncbi:MAG: electron transfer flavoprotein subunit beta/FixA family protein [Syntrophomonadaceae bacterium]|nr:electron transfer flavoprotein subunit beta/FixA family protein [Syntrophomonadaceae bacterium]
MKQIPDLQQIRIRNRKPVLEDVPLTFGNIDKNALEEGVRLKEESEGQLIVLSAGSEELEDTVKEALAAGADEACLITTGLELDSSGSACLLAEAIKQMGNVDLILFGEGSGDNYSSQVGSRVAELLDLPAVGYASQLNVNGDTVIITRSLEDCDEELEVKLPVVVSVMAGLNEPRLPSVTQILKAGKKPKEIVEADDMDIECPESKIETLENLAPEMQRKQIVLKNSIELVNALSNEGLIGRE